MVSGHKVKYEDKKHNFKFEMCIFNEKYKDLVLHDHARKLSLPFYISFFLIIIKTLYYRLGILPKYIYVDLKNFLMDDMLDGRHAEYFFTEKNL
jgi:hypothetical protein